jgi:hypothetical protein
MPAMIKAVQSTTKTHNPGKGLQADDHRKHCCNTLFIKSITDNKQLP